VAAHAAIASTSLALNVFERPQIKGDQRLPKVRLTHPQTATNQALWTTGARRTRAIGIAAITLLLFEKIVHVQHGFAVLGRMEMASSWAHLRY
jgi:hypothetical protein